MKTIAVLNQKGGSGKTTTCVNLSAALGGLGKRVLVLDVDPQASSTAWLAVQDPGAGVLPVFLGESTLEQAIRSTEITGVSVAPASPKLATLERVVAQDEKLSLNPNGLLKRALRKASRLSFDYCLIDCPPNLGITAKNALVAADSVLIPVEAHYLALEGLVQLLETIEAVSGSGGLNQELEIEGVLACRVDYRTAHCQEVIAKLKKKFGRTLFDTVIRENIRLAEAPGFRLPVILYAPISAGAQDYTALAGELLKRKAVSFKRAANF